MIDAPVDREEMKRLMREAGLSQKEFARRIGVSVQTLYHWDDGHRGGPIPLWVRAILQAWIDIRRLETRLQAIDAQIPSLD